MRLSVVTTMFQSAPYVSEFYQRIRTEAEKLMSDFEIIFVNDGSMDSALEVALDLQKVDPRIRIIDLSRNFGHHKAMMTGLEHARGDLLSFLPMSILRSHWKSWARFSKH